MTITTLLTVLTITMYGRMLVMEFDDKTMALAKFLKIDPALIENNYSDYYSVNGRTIKEGRTPEGYKQLAEDFRALLTEDDQALVTEAMLNPGKKIKITLPAIGDKEKEEKEYLLTEFVYNKVDAALEAMKVPSEKRIEQLARLNSGTWKPPIKETPLDIFARLRTEHLHVSNILYYLIKAEADKYNNDDHMVSLRRAWLGQPVNDTRKDRDVDDGEYLVLTDSEADDWEEEGLRSLLDDMIPREVRDSFLSNYIDVDRWVEDNSGNRGENINGYDGTEDEVEFEGTTYYIYRNN